MAPLTHEPPTRLASAWHELSTLVSDPSVHRALVATVQPLYAIASFTGLTRAHLIARSAGEQAAFVLHRAKMRLARARSLGAWDEADQIRWMRRHLEEYLQVLRQGLATGSTGQTNWWQACKEALAASEELEWIAAQMERRGSVAPARYLRELVEKAWKSDLS